MFNHDDRQLLRQVAQQVAAILEQQHLLLARVDTITAELVLLRQSETAMMQILLALELAEEKELNQLDRITSRLTSP